ncbi:MAG TPA: 2-oxo acid dehydrogenase subunit E2, partial [Gemmatimonadales bacterium]|nr:2-oxo acid dehydrogenase subunit E2 [Gemmatimonadales bacterium]
MFETANAGFAQVMYEEYLRNPGSVDPAWRQLFETGVAGVAADSGQGNGNGAAGAARAAEATPPAPDGRAAPVASPPAANGAAPANGTLIKGPAAKLVGNMNESLTVPTATTFRELSVAALERQRKALNDALKAAGRGEKVSFTHLIGWAIVQATKQHPVMGHTLAMHDGQPYRVAPAGVNLGLAVDVTRKDGSRGLVVPVIKRAESMDFAGFHAAYEQLVEKARTNKLMPDDFAGATMSLTNPGGLGTVASVPRLMAGQGSIIAVGAITYPPEFATVAPERIRELGVSKVMTVTSTYDHRVIQGAESGAFLATVDAMLQGEHGFYDGVFGSLGVGGAAGAAPAARTGTATAPAAPPAPIAAG